MNDGIEREAESTRASRCQVRASGATLTWIGIWTLALALLFPLAGLAWEPRLEPPVRSDPEAGPQSMTAEQREEAERFKKQAAKYGTDPTAFVGRLQLSSTYYDLPQVARAVDTIVRVDLSFRKDFLLRGDTPFLKWRDPDGVAG